MRIDQKKKEVAGVLVVIGLGGTLLSGRS